MSDFFCTECKEPCGAIEETWDYSGTHCNHGVGGVHHSGVYVSDCCDAEITEDEPQGEDYE